MDTVLWVLYIIFCRQGRPVTWYRFVLCLFIIRWRFHRCVFVIRTPYFVCSAVFSVDGVSHPNTVFSVWNGHVFKIPWQIILNERWIECYIWPYNWIFFLLSHINLWIPSFEYCILFPSSAVETCDVVPVLNFEIISYWNRVRMPYFEYRILFFVDRWYLWRGTGSYFVFSL